MIGAVLVIAYGGNAPAVMGHTASEINIHIDGEGSKNLYRRKDFEA